MPNMLVHCPSPMVAHAPDPSLHGPFPSFLLQGESVEEEGEEREEEAAAAAGGGNSNDDKVSKTESEQSMKRRGPPAGPTMAGPAKAAPVFHVKGTACHVPLSHCLRIKGR